MNSEYFKPFLLEQNGDQLAIVQECIDATQDITPDRTTLTVQLPTDRYAIGKNIFGEDYCSAIVVIDYIANISDTVARIELRKKNRSGIIIDLCDVWQIRRRDLDAGELFVDVIPFFPNAAYGDGTLTYERFIRYPAKQSFPYIQKMLAEDEADPYNASPDACLSIIADELMASGVEWKAKIECSRQYLNNSLNQVTAGLEMMTFYRGLLPINTQFSLHQSFSRTLPASNHTDKMVQTLAEVSHDYLHPTAADTNHFSFSASMHDRIRPKKLLLGGITLSPDNFILEPIIEPKTHTLEALGAMSRLR